MGQKNELRRLPFSHPIFPVSAATITYAAAMNRTGRLGSHHGWLGLGGVAARSWRFVNLLCLASGLAHMFILARSFGKASRRARKLNQINPSPSNANGTVK